MGGACSAAQPARINKTFMAPAELNKSQNAPKRQSTPRFTDDDEAESPDSSEKRFK